MLTASQQTAYELLSKTDKNIFLTGGAGTGKSYLIKKFISESDKYIECTASTGAAAILIEGCTFHRFFGLGIIKDQEELIKRALSNDRVWETIGDAETIIIDEISMLSGAMITAADAICKKIRGNEDPFGGIRMIAVGDFFQLPPITMKGEVTDWAFNSPSWCFETVELTELVRSDNEEFHTVLNQLRVGCVSNETDSYLKSKHGYNEEYTRIFSTREEVSKWNDECLSRIQEQKFTYKTTTSGPSMQCEALLKVLPVDTFIHLKKNAHIMLRANDPDGSYVNGSTGIIEKIDDDNEEIHIILDDKQRKVVIRKKRWELLAPKGEVLASARQFPISLAYAITIHKAQGASIDNVEARLTRVWEFGQSYVAISRAKNPDTLLVPSYERKKILVSPEVLRFHNIEVQKPKTIVNLGGFM